MFFRRFITFIRNSSFLLLLALWAMPLSHVDAQTNDWERIKSQAEGQTVYFNAWGGSQPVNDYLQWVSNEVQANYGVQLEHVKIDDAALVVQRILNEKTAGVDDAGKVDLIWINGENFKAMKQQDLLSEPFTHQLPNFRFVDTKNKPTTLIDFGVATDGLESPWGMAQLVFYYDSQYVETPPNSMQTLLKLAEEQPGRVAYPAPPAFHGTAFLKQALLELVDDRSVLQMPVSEVDFAQITAPLWDFLDELHPLLWQQGESFPRDGSQILQLVNDGILVMGMTFNPYEASRAIANGELPESIRSYVHADGTIGNTHFVAIPYNASATAGAKVVANFLLSPQAQARKANANIWGDPSVLDIDQLSPERRQEFADLPAGAADLSPEELGQVLPEPDTSWVPALEAAWLAHYSQ